MDVKSWRFLKGAEKDKMDKDKENEAIHAGKERGVTLLMADLLSKAYSDPRAAINLGMAQWRDMARALWGPWMAPAAGAGLQGESRQLESSSLGSSTRSARLYAPESAKPGAPLLVMLHGCMQDAQSFSKLTRMDDLAKAEGFFVLYPDQESSANPMQCWNWNSKENQSRDGGEPEALADLIRQAQEICETGPKLTRACGISAGAALASTMACLYPELLGSVAVVAGPAPFAAQSLGEALGTMASGPSKAANERVLGKIGEIEKALGPGGARLPMLIVQGQADDTVNPKHAMAQERAALALNDALDDGLIDGSLGESLAESKSNGGSARVWADSKGGVIAVVIEPKNLGHAWSGGDVNEPFSQRGFDQSRLALDFFEAAETGEWSGFQPDALRTRLFGDEAEHPHVKSPRKTRKP